MRSRRRNAASSLDRASSGRPDRHTVLCARFQPPAAIRLAVRLIDLAESLSAFPDRGRQIRHGLREAVSIRPYVIRYAILPSEIRIITIRHSARRPEG
ncbi:MAG: type II toxin-antitoxin system RelE/ParE family toxin [Brevundimonas aurantiaca]